MASSALHRTDYWNRLTGTVRNGDTRHDETVTDIESFILPYLRSATAGLHLWGVADGLTVTATTGQAGLTVRPGVAVDGAGQVIVLIAGGRAVTNQGIDPADVANIATVAVDADGVSVDTAGITGVRCLTVRYVESGEEGLLGNAPTLNHSPWLRLVDVNGFDDTGAEVALAEVTLAKGAVTALSAGLRRLAAAVSTDRLQLRRPIATAAATLSVGHGTAAEVAARVDGGVDVTLLSPNKPPVTALTINPIGSIGVGLDADDKPLRPLHVEGSVHSGGSTGGFSFADRATGTFVEDANAGQRWEWYAQGGTARLWSGFDRISVSATGEGGGLDVARRMRVRQAQDASAGIWFFQTAAGDRAFVGMSDDDHVGFWGNAGAQWGLTMDARTGGVSINNDLEVGGSPDFATPASPTIYGRNNTEENPAGPIGVALFPFTPAGVMGEALSGHGVRAKSRDGTGLYAEGGHLAAFFAGDIQVSGKINKSAVHFKIDHPLDPGRKFLQHSAMESDELKNLYDGVVTLDTDGCAEVKLPLWFEALNEEFRYQLTAVGAAAPSLHIAGELDGGRFSIAGGPPGGEVCWQVTGIRHDAYARANPLQVEVDKSGDEIGMFLHPVAHGVSEELSIARIM